MSRASKPYRFRYAVAVALALMLVFGADAPDNYKAYAPAFLRYLWPRNAHAAINPRTFGIVWARDFNLRATASRSKLRVWAIRCGREGEAVFTCNVLFYVRPHGYECANVALGSSGEIFAVRRVVCGAAVLRAAGIAPSKAAAPKA